MSVRSANSLCATSLENTNFSSAPLRDNSNTSQMGGRRDEKIGWELGGGGGGYGRVRENIRGGGWIWPIMKGLLTPPHLSGMIAVLDRWGDRGEN